MPILEGQRLTKFFGGLAAVLEVDFAVDQGEILGLIGPNGAGKTTLLNTLSGLHPRASGTETFMGRRIDELSPHLVVDLGLSHIPAGRRLFPDMSVHENLEMGAYPERAWSRRAETLKQVYSLFPRLRERRGQLAGTLSGGEQQMLAMGRGLMSRPSLCAIDEPSNGLAPIAVSEFFKIMGSLHRQGITIFLIEQNIKHALEIADRAYVLENGRIVLEGPSRELLETDHIRKAYLGL